ncbi:DNA replication regulator sld2 [Aspergillus brasiliensis]|nr:DNA replication regulator sld2 [Aspergillus brasiliensis]
MATVMAPEMATQSANLRAELKEWERAFADANGGRKADRSDIKKVPEIAAKYKEYSRLKALETSSNKTDKHPVQLEERPKKRKHTSPNGPSTSLTTSTPRKTAKGAAAFETPSKSRPVATSHPSEVDPYDSPSVLRRLFSPSTHQTPLKTAIGPTPQRDGKALGLFDLLSESGGSTATPSATRIASLRDTAVQTPSRRRKQLDTIAEEGEEEEDDEDDNSPRGARTPASSGKKWMLSTLFATPTTWRYAMMENENQGPRYPAYIRTEDTAAKPTEPHTGPNSEETPSFLRRSTATRFNPHNHTADDGGLSPIAVRKRPQFVGKGLSALVQGLRDMEEEQMQDDMDVLLEIEAEQLQQQQQAAGAVADSQTQQYPPTEETRPFKKKGQKRTTRKVRMKPVTSKPKAEPQLPVSDDEEEDNQNADADIVLETQYPNIPGTEAHDTDEDDLHSLHSLSRSEPDLDPDYDYDEDEEALSKPPARSKSFSERMKEAIEADKLQAPAKAEEDTEKEKEKKKTTKSKAQTQTQTQPRARKINPAAHANYRSLKLRNRGSKGRGRFGRR